jgi:hypothetical protein
MRCALGAASPPPLVAEPPEANMADPLEVVTLRGMSTDRALWRVAARRLDIGTVVDVGASNGMWSAVWLA